jgi:hypothetical protein
MGKPIENDDAKLDAMFNDLDFFLVMSAGADSERSDAVAASVLMVKYNLHRLFYPVSFDRTEHPSADPDFYNVLASFERRADLQVDSKFTWPEFQRLTFLASLDGEPKIGVAPKMVHGGEAYASAGESSPFALVAYIGRLRIRPPICKLI